MADATVELASGSFFMARLRSRSIRDRSASGAAAVRPRQRSRGDPARGPSQYREPRSRRDAATMQPELLLPMSLSMVVESPRMRQGDSTDMIPPSGAVNPQRAISSSRQDDFEGSRFSYGVAKVELAARAATFGISSLSIFKNFDADRLADLCVSLGIAFVLATLIGAERQYRQRNAGLRTNVLVAVGAAAFVTFGMRINGAAGASQIAAYVVSGIGFLGAGVIMKEGAQISGLNTAATLWCSAAVGALCGGGLAAEAGALTVAILAGNTALRPLVNAINRAPIDQHSSEATYEVHVATGPEHVGEVRDILAEALENANYPIREIEVVQRAPGVSEIVATLISTAVDPVELDAVVGLIEHSPHVSYASWAVSAPE